MKEIVDLALASYLSTIGHKLISVKSNARRFTFIFKDSEIFESDVLGFYNRTARVDPLTFAEVFRNLKALTLRS